MSMWSAKNSQGYNAPAAVSSEAVVFSWVNNQLSLLVIQREKEPFKDTYQLPGGFLNNQENPEDTARRKLKEKTGVDAPYLEQLGTYGDVDRDPRGWTISIAYLALIPQPLYQSQHFTWLPVSELEVCDLAFDHKKIVFDALSRLNGKLWYSNVAVGLLGEEFTLRQALKVYQSITQVEYDFSNFRRDLLNSKLIEETGSTTASNRGRPATLYRFISKNPAWTPAKGTKKKF